MASVSSSGTDPKDADSAPIVQNGKNPNDQSRLLSTSAPAEHGAAQSDPHHPSEGAIIRQKHKKGRGGSHDEGASNTPSVDGGRDITPHPSVSRDCVGVCVKGAQTESITHDLRQHTGQPR